VETQAAASYSAWQVLEAAVNGAQSLDDQKIADWLKNHQVKTIQGVLRFDRLNNFGDDLMKVKQVQDGRWVTVWPDQWAAPGAKIKAD
jgi:branched-chain amino acid transport system substrate-binding protein